MTFLICSPAKQNLMRWNEIKWIFWFLFLKGDHDWVLSPLLNLNPHYEIKINASSDADSSGMNGNEETEDRDTI